MMQFQVTKIEFDFAGDNLFTENDRLDLIEETIGSVWVVDDEDDLIEEMSNLLTFATFFPEMYLPQNDWNRGTYRELKAK